MKIFYDNLTIGPNKNQPPVLQGGKGGKGCHELTLLFGELRQGGRVTE